MPSEISTGKTVFILAAVVGCFAILWPRLFHPMLQSALYQKSSLDNTVGCCDVISDMDVNAIKILTEMCGRIVTKHSELDAKFLSDFEQGKMSKEVVNTCKREVFNTCGVDITSFLAEQVGLGQTYRQILENIKSFNNSVCLKQNFGLERGLLGAARHWSHSPLKHLRQERPPHMRPDLINAALRERGRAIPQSNVIPRILEGRPGPIPGMRPPMGGAGHVVPPPKATQGALGILMPLYTIGIVMIFVYTMMKLLMRRSNEAESASNFQSDPSFRQYVFGDHHGGQNGTNKYRFDQPTKLVETAISGLLAEVDRQRENVAKQAEQLSGKGENGLQAEPMREAEADQEAASVKVVNMETTASCEGGKPWTGSRPSTPTSRSRPPSRPPTPLEREAATIPPPQDAQEIYLEGALPSQAQLLVAESETEAHKVEGDEVTSKEEVVSLSASTQDSNKNEITLKESDVPPKSPSDLRKKKITFICSDDEDDVEDNHEKAQALEEEAGEMYNFESAKDDECDENPLIESTLSKFKVDGQNVHVNRLEKLSSLDVEYLQSEIDSLIEEAIECVQYEQENKYQELEDGDEYEESEEEEVVEGEEDEEHDFNDDVESDILNAIKESEKMRKSVHRQVEEVTSSMPFKSSQKDDGSSVESTSIDVPLKVANESHSETKVLFSGEEEDYEEEEVGEEVEEEEVEDEEIEEEEEVEEEELVLQNNKLGLGKAGYEGAKMENLNKTFAVDHEVELEEEEEEEEELEDEEIEEETEEEEEEEEIAHVTDDKK